MAAEGTETVLAPTGLPKAPYGSFAGKVSQHFAAYRLLEPHWINNTYYDVNTIITEGQEVPQGWSPSLAVDPQNSDAVQSFYAAGPRGSCYEDLNSWQNYTMGKLGGGVLISPIPPTTFWKQQSGSDMWQLTGLGVGLPPRQ